MPVTLLVPPQKLTCFYLAGTVAITLIIKPYSELQAFWLMLSFSVVPGFQSSHFLWNMEATISANVRLAVSFFCALWKAIWMKTQEGVTDMQDNATSSAWQQLTYIGRGPILGVYNGLTRPNLCTSLSSLQSLQPVVQMIAWSLWIGWNLVHIGGGGNDSLHV